ncbi:hypothetical protein [Mesorhizobium sangaii]|uniref:Uncharacterized protein n=1 Tax=Mesorhizobium sangaii TaxID=505389 RepID=A0A841PGS0_9HYPH|nr:hypothetical protein [Mesorhizobium sangaii]MBB6412813.1 hypothetical protein [Mesorhizobium sangaii]
MRKSATILAKITLGVMLATGSATVSMARSGGGDGHAVHFSSGAIGNRQHHKVFFSGRESDDREHDSQLWLNDDTDTAYCSFDAVNPSYYGSNGIWHSCL